MHRPPDRSYLLPEPRAADTLVTMYGLTPGGSSLSAWAAHRSAQIQAVEGRNSSSSRRKRAGSAVWSWWPVLHSTSRRHRPSC